MFRAEYFFYRSKNSIIHRLDPRSKLIYVIIMFILALARGDLIYLLIVFIMSLIPIFLGKIFHNFIASLRASIFFIVLIILINYIFSFNIFLAISLTLRFLILISSFIVFSITTSPDDLALALYRTRFPYDFVLTFNLSIRFIPTVFRDAINIIDAQRSRGLETQKGFLKRIRNYLPIIIPLIVVGIRRAINVAESMEARGFGATKKPTTLYELKFTLIDYFFIISSLLLFSLIFLI